MARIISIASGKGGVGKSTTAINLGIALTKYFNKKVALIDCNLTTAHIGLYLGMYSTPITLNSALRDESSISGALYIHPSGLRIVPASLNLQDLHGIEDSKLTSTIKELSEDFDFVLLDSAPGVGKEAMMALKACNEVLFVVNPYIPSAVDVAKIVNLCHTLNKQELQNINLLGVVLNRIEDADYELSKEEIEKLTNLSIIGNIPEDKEILQSVNTKNPAVILNPNSGASKAYIKLAAALVGEKYDEKLEETIEIKPLSENGHGLPSTKEKVETEENTKPKPTELTEAQKKEIAEKVEMLIAEKTPKKPGFWKRVFGFFFRR